MARPKDLRGQRFGWLEPLERVESDSKGKARWLCRCHGCGGQCVVRGVNMTRPVQPQVSCGCHRVAVGRTTGLSEPAHATRKKRCERRGCRKVFYGPPQQLYCSHACRPSGRAKK